MMILILIAVAVSIGFQFAIEPDMILQEYRKLLLKLYPWKIGTFKMGYWLAKPLGLCITCNSHWVGFILFMFNIPAFTGHVDSNIGKWVTIEFCSLAVSGISTFVWFIYNTLKDYKNLLNVKEELMHKQIDFLDK